MAQDRSKRVLEGQQKRKTKSVKEALVLCAFEAQNGPKGITWSHLGGCQVPWEPLGAA